MADQTWKNHLLKDGASRPDRPRCMLVRFANSQNGQGCPSVCDPADACYYDPREMQTGCTGRVTLLFLSSFVVP